MQVHTKTGHLMTVILVVSYCSHASGKSRAVQMRLRFFLAKLPEIIRHRDCQLASMFESSVPVTEPSTPYHNYGRNHLVATTANPAQADQDLVENQAGFLSGVARRWRRERQRRKVGRAYDMALEITRALQRIPHGASVLDVGC